MPSSVRLPVRFAERTLATFQPPTTSARKALTAAWRVVAGEIRSLVLVGPTGVGKTHLAAGIVNAIVDRDRTAYGEALRAAESAGGGRYPAPPDTPAWENVADLIVSLRLEIDRPLDDREATYRIRSLRTWRGVVVLDDLGREKISDWTGETIYAVVNARYEEQLPTIVTSNLTAVELGASPYWPAISRLAEDGALVAIDAPDHRLLRRVAS